MSTEHLVFRQESLPDLNLEQAVAQWETNLIRRALNLYPHEPHKALGMDAQSFEQKKKQRNL